MNLFMNSSNIMNLMVCVSLNTTPCNAHTHTHMHAPAQAHAGRERETSIVYLDIDETKLREGTKTVN